MAYTAGDPGEQSAADAAQSAAVDAATSGGRDFGSDSGPQSGPNVGGKDFGQNLQNRPQGPAFGGMDMSPGRSRSMFGTTYGTQLAGIDQGRFNQMRGITATNPFGRDNIFSKYLGIDPKNIDYSDNISLSNRISIANNQFSKFVNPQNRRGMPGYNPAYATAEEGKLRAGVQDEGYMTAYGPVMEQARQQSTGEMIARGLASLTPIGPFVSMMGTKEYGLPGQPGFESFDPNNPRAGGGIASAMLGGLNPTQAKDALVGAFAPVAPAPTPTSIGTTTSPMDSWSAGRDAAKKQAFTDAVSSVMNQAQTSPSIANMSLEDKKIAINELAEINYQPYLDAMPDIDYVPGQRISTVSTTGGIDAATAKKADEIFGPSSLSYDFYTDPQAGGTYPSAMAGEQLAGIFGENPKAAGFRGLGESIKSIINKENLPDNQNMYGPGTPNLNEILNAYGMKEVG